MICSSYNPASPSCTFSNTNVCVRVPVKAPPSESATPLRSHWYFSSLPVAATEKGTLCWPGLTTTVPWGPDWISTACSTLSAAVLETELNELAASTE